MVYKEAIIVFHTSITPRYASMIRPYYVQEATSHARRENSSRTPAGSIGFRREYRLFLLIRSRVRLQRPFGQHDENRVMRVIKCNIASCLKIKDSYSRRVRYGSMCSQPRMGKHLRLDFSLGRSHVNRPSSKPPSPSWESARLYTVPRTEHRTGGRWVAYH